MLVYRVQCYGGYVGSNDCKTNYSRLCSSYELDILIGETITEPEHGECYLSPFLNKTEAIFARRAKC